MDKTMTDEEVLRNAGVRVTAVRLMVWRTIRHQMDGVFGLADLETQMPTMERSTLFRTLTLLSESHLLHTVDDGSGMQRYCLCHHDDTRHCEGHVHLTCRICHQTICMPDLKIPQVALPAGFQAEETEYIVKGICQKCARKA